MISRDTTAGLFMNRMGNPTLPDSASVYENLYFDGSENILLYRKDLELTLTCNFMLQNYPFDQQTCLIEVYQYLYYFILQHDTTEPTPTRPPQ